MCSEIYNLRTKWSNLLPVFLVLVFIAEISFVNSIWLRIWISWILQRNHSTGLWNHVVIKNGQICCLSGSLILQGRSRRLKLVKLECGLRPLKAIRFCVSCWNMYTSVLCFCSVFCASLLVVFIGFRWFLHRYIIIIHGDVQWFFISILCWRFSLFMISTVLLHR